MIVRFSVFWMPRTFTVDRIFVLQLLTEQLFTCKLYAKTHGRRNRGVWGEGQCPPTFGTSGVQGIQRGGPMKMIFASTADSLYSVLYK